MSLGWKLSKWELEWEKTAPSILVVEFRGWESHHRWWPWLGSQEKIIWEGKVSVQGRSSTWERGLNFRALVQIFLQTSCSPPCPIYCYMPIKPSFYVRFWLWLLLYRWCILQPMVSSDLGYQCVCGSLNTLALCVNSSLYALLIIVSWMLCLVPARCSVPICWLNEWLEAVLLPGTLP